LDENDTDYSFGDFTLREALALGATLPGKEVIRFDESLLDATIVLESNLEINGEVEIAGPRADRLAIDGDSTWYVRLYEATAEMSGLTITGMESIYGALFVWLSDATLDGVSISDNDTDGLYVNYEGTIVVSNSTIANNDGHGVESAYLGGQAGDQLFVNVTISGNTVDGYNNVSGSADITFVNSTIADNGGAGIWDLSSSGPLLYNTIVADNVGTYDYVAFINSLSSNNLIGSSLIPASYGGPEDGVHGMVGVASARLAPLGYYGGPTKMHALLYDSLAIDAGDNDFVDDFELAYDQRGSDRIVDRDLDLDARVDIGAFELALTELFS
jgi:parallel beta-helix repeat protein